MTTPGLVGQDIDEWETVITDQRLGRVQERVAERYPQLRDATFVTFIQPGKLLTDVEPPREIPEMAVFAILSPNPRHAGHSVMTHGTAALTDFLESDETYGHFVGLPDPAFGIFLNVARAHLQVLQNLREMN